MSEQITLALCQLEGRFMTAVSLSLRLETDSEVTTRKVVGVAGNILSLNCMTDGSPQPEITWLIDGMQLDNSTVTSRKTG